MPRMKSAQRKISRRISPLWLSARGRAFAPRLAHNSAGSKFGEVIGGYGKVMGEFAIGQSVLRREDPRLLRGLGRYFDDLKLADQLHAAVVRSPHAHADIRGIDTGAARQMPGVHAVLTGADYAADALGPLPSMAPYKKRDGGPMYLPLRPAIAIDRAMHVGYPVAVVVADTLDRARDAAE